LQANRRPMKPPFPSLRPTQWMTAEFLAISAKVHGIPPNSNFSPMPSEPLMYRFCPSFPCHWTPVLILLAALAITFWVCDSKQFSQATRVICSTLTCIIAIILGVFVCTGYSTEHSAAVILFEGIFLAIQFGISHIAHAVKTPS